MIAYYQFLVIKIISKIAFDIISYIIKKLFFQLLFKN